MKKQIASISLLHNAKLMAVIYLVLSVPLVLIMSIPLLMSENAGGSLFVMILMPLMYAIFGFVFTLIGAWVYNFIAARFGGFEFTTGEAGRE
jgi:hypothetical protein